MTILPLLYWIILILSLVGIFGPANWPGWYRLGPSIVLFIIIGIKYFRIPLAVIALSCILASCSGLTPAQKDFINSRIVAAAASRGVTPSDSKAVLKLLDNSAANFQAKKL